MVQRCFTVWWGCGGGLAAPAEILFLALAEPPLCQSQKKSISWRACALQTSRDCKTETAGFETCLIISDLLTPEFWLLALHDFNPRLAKQPMRPVGHQNHQNSAEEYQARDAWLGGQ